MKKRQSKMKEHKQWYDEFIQLDLDDEKAVTKFLNKWWHTNNLIKITGGEPNKEYVQKS